ncbi:MAG: hypothetical protein IJ269_02250 [Bacteroidales bacterium]|jgi:hypothetical protein|nr:hypothetical protein [Bacteroidales bacterium]MBQ8045155.1 hypothetical protein [Bacteroidales bacterium]MBR7167898.1 hypothetical protein [Bacteroidales bacterium]
MAIMLVIFFILCVSEVLLCISTAISITLYAFDGGSQSSRVTGGQYPCFLPAGGFDP